MSDISISSDMSVQLTIACQNGIHVYAPVCMHVYMRVYMHV